jgi:predicted transcriptional regulator of viral defense system
MENLPQWLSRAVKAQVITHPQALELAVLQEQIPDGEYVDVPEHLREATAQLWLWETPPVNELPV